MPVNVLLYIINFRVCCNKQKVHLVRTLINFFPADALFLSVLVPFVLVSHSVLVTGEQPTSH